MGMIYLDHNATTPVAPEVFEAMVPFLRDHFGNPSSAHQAGRVTRAAVERARGQVAALIGADPDEIVFTGSGTEANNQVIKGLFHLHRDRQPHVVISAVEHAAVDQPCRFLEAYGLSTTRVPVDGTGRVDPEAVRAAIRPETILVSIMHANNEVGTIQPIREIAAIARHAGVLMHTDAAQSLGKVAVNVRELGVDFLSIAGHKVYAPEGVGALFVRRGAKLAPLLHGASHERGMRAGTEAVPAIVGLGAAALLAADPTRESRLGTLRDRLHHALVTALEDGVVLNGHPTLRLPNTLNVSFPGLIGAEVLALTPEVCASSGAACHDGSHKPSAVLTAMSIDVRRALGAVRLSVGMGNTDAEMDRAAELLVATVKRMSS